ncbi:CHC2 zinc finger domain protein, partial [Fusobacterium sp. CM21]
MFYSEEIVDEVREKNDIVDVISPYVRLTRRGSNYVGLCPFHSEKTPSFSVNGSKQIFHCFGCGVGGNSISFVMKYENLTFTEAVKQLADKAGIKL